MRKLKKLCAVLLTVAMLLSCCTAVLSVSAEDVVTDETTEATTITEDPVAFLYSNAVAAATAAGATTPTVGNTRIAISQTAAWRVASTTPTANSFSDVPSVWLRYNSSSSLDARYGHSTWSYTTPSIRVNYQYGNTANKILTTLLRPNSTPDGDRKNAFMSLYYIAETSGDFTLTDDIGGFTVRESAASGYEVYVTILANGVKIFESQPLSRVNRIARFSGETFYLEEGQKLEINFTYKYTADTYSGDINIDFDPKLTLVSEYVEETPELEGDGEVAQVLYNALDLLEASGTNTSKTVAQTAVWRAQYYSSSKWYDLTHYCNHTKVTTGGLNWGYDRGSYSQHDRISLRYNNSKVEDGLYIKSEIPMQRSSMKQSRLSYTAEYDGTYTLTDKFNEFIVNQRVGGVYNFWIQITHNGTVLWKSDYITATGQEVPFNGVSVDMSEGDNLSIEFRYAKIDSSSTGYDAKKTIIHCSPVLTYLPPAVTEEYSAKETFLGLFDEIVATEPTATVTGSGISQESTGWIFKHGFSFETLTPLTYYGYNPDAYWGGMRLHPSNSQAGSEPSITYVNGSSSDGYKNLMVHLRSCVSSSGFNSSHYYAYEYAYTFKAVRNGAHVLSETDFWLRETATIPGVVLKIYKNGSLFYTSDMLCNANMSVTIPEIGFMLNAGDELTFYFERQHTASDNNWNHNLYAFYTPVITYYEDASVVEEKSGYSPESATRYYAENLTVPASVTAYVNTNAVIAGNIIDSDAFALEITEGGNPAVSYLSGETEKQIVFPVDVRGEWAKLTVSYDSTNSAWNCLVNDIVVSTVNDADFVSGGAIEKLYIGASADKYNLGSFKGEIAELSITNGSDTVSFVLNDVKSEEGLVAEAVAYVEDHDDTGLTFKNKNSRLDLYEKFASAVATYEAWVKLPTDYVDSRSAGRILGTSYNYPPYSQLNIVAGGKPQLYAYDGTTTTTLTFDVDIRSDEFVHLAITAECENDTFNCYVDGVLVDTKESTLEIPVGTRPYLISGDYFYNNTPVNFEGDLAGVAMFGDIRTQDEIIADMYGETDLTDSELFGKWSLADKNEGLVNQNGNGNDFHPFWDDEADSVVDESYGDYSTFVFIPDTQNFTQSQGKTGISAISNWILNNKDAENIVGVIGLGDITNNNGTSQWDAAAQGYSSLLGAVPYVFVAGNHDYGTGTTNEDGTFTRNTANYNTYFSFDEWSPYIDGYFEEGSMDNFYVLTETAQGTKYMMLGLEFLPRDEVLQWANKVVAAHPDYNVIVSTHGYQSYDYYSEEQTYVGTGYDSICGTDNKNGGQDIWDKFVSQHANITMIACGHTYHEDIHVTTKTGVNGNTVTEVLANAQTTDALMRMSGTVMIVKVSEDGTKANVNFYSPYHDHYLKDLNQFEMNWSVLDTSVAEINGVKYETLAEAVAAANAGETVKLIADAKGEGLVINKDITIDFGGFTYTVTTPVGSTGTVSNGLQLLKGNNVTLKNGTLKVADDAKSDFYILVQNYTNLTVTDMVLDGTNLDKYSLTDGDSITLSNNCGNVVVDGKTDIIANDDGDLALAFDVYKSAYYDAPVVTVNTTGEIKGNIDVTAEIAENLNIEAGIFNTDVSAYIASGAGLKLIDGVYTIADAALIADIDANGKVDASDLSYIRQTLLEKISDGKVYDINGDGDIDIRDLVRIKKLAATA